MLLFLSVLLGLGLALSATAEAVAESTAWPSGRSRPSVIHEDRWSPPQRPSFYVNLLAFGGVLSEDGDNRLTARASKRLEGGGGIFRVGAVVEDHHLIGFRSQAYVRSSRVVLNEDGLVTDDCWGLVIHGFAGPEYRYVTDIGLYVGAAVGAGVAVGLDDVEEDHCGAGTRCRYHHGTKDDTDVHRAIGLSALVSLGHEIRTTRYFALYLELFGGFSQGLDENDKAMENGIVGLAFGLGI